MKHTFLLLLLSTLMSLNSLAQNTNVVTWTFSSAKGNNPNEYLITATANIQKGFHIFSTNPGGDGLLIPTEITIHNKKDFKKIGTLTPQRRPITKEMEGIGMVNYFEGTIEFSLIVECTQPIELDAMISSQACNDVMCFPPTDQSFKIKL